MSDFEKNYRSRHKRLSTIKSYLRMFGACFVMAELMLFRFEPFLGMMLFVFAFTFFVAEILGLLEESV